MHSSTPATLPPLPLEAWEQSKITLHLFTQIVGKIRLRLMPKRNHWWHVPLYITSRGWTTRPIPFGDLRFEIGFDFLDHKVLVTTNRGDLREFPLQGLSVADFYAQLFATLKELEIEVKIRPIPYDLPDSIPFAEDHKHSAYDPEYVRRFWQIHTWINSAFWEFSGRFIGKTSPIHLFWHSLDLAVTRFSGREAPPMEGANRVNRDAYTHEVISFGFWAGDQKVPEAAFYSYTFPAPDGLREESLRPERAFWGDQYGSPMALYRYEDFLQDGATKERLLEFLESAYQAGAKRAGWEIEKLRLKA